jgi:hypothetical protein
MRVMGILAAALLSTSTATAQVSNSGPRTVVDVAPDDVLYVRGAPGATSPIAGALTFDASDIKLTGNTADIDGTRWVEVKARRVTGWASASYLGMATPFSTADARHVTPLRTVRTRSVDEAVKQLEALLRRQHPPDGEVKTAIKIVGVTKEALPRVMFNIEGYGDDSVRGEDMVVRLKRDGGTWVVSDVDIRSLCSRGVSGALCL